MPYIAKHKYARITARKARLVMDLVRGRDVDDALSMLQFSKKRAGVFIGKAIRSAVGNYHSYLETHNIRASGAPLYIAEARADEGPTIKRFQPKDRGKAHPIMKRTSHLVISIEERE